VIRDQLKQTENQSAFEKCHVLSRLFFAMLPRSAARIRSLDRLYRPHPRQGLAGGTVKVILALPTFSKRS
jgi:hypothetical protein